MTMANTKLSPPNLAAISEPHTPARPDAANKEDKTDVKVGEGAGLRRLILEGGIYVGSCELQNGPFTVIK